MKPVRRWKIKKVVIELYEAYARTRQEAIEVVESKGNPHSVIIKSQTAVALKD